MEHDLLERENRQRSEALAGKMGRLKDIAIDLHMETLDQNTHLGNMGNDFDSTEGLLSGSVKRIGHMVSSGKGNRKLICYMVSLAVIMFFIIMFIAKFSSSGNP
ncbi:BET1-like protein [Watersipora subatra]|uniref:BET1-like protein n=1 Tax=Watersipora subatra TaxID=2589382 RepID=UPI00355C08B8